MHRPTVSSLCMQHDALVPTHSGWLLVCSVCLKCHLLSLKTLNTDVLRTVLVI